MRKFPNINEQAIFKEICKVSRQGKDIDLNKKKGVQEERRKFNQK